MAQWERETARGVAEQRAREQETAEPPGFVASALPKGFNCPRFGRELVWRDDAQAHQPMSSEYRLVFELFRSCAQEQQTLQPPVMGQHPCFSRLRENDSPDVPLRGDLQRMAAYRAG